MTAALSPLPELLPEASATPSPAGAGAPGEFAAVLGEQAAGAPAPPDAGSGVPTAELPSLPPLPGTGNLLPPALTGLLQAGAGGEHQNPTATLTELPTEVAQQALATIARAQTTAGKPAATPAAPVAGPEVLAAVTVPNRDPEASLNPARPVVPGAVVAQTAEALRLKTDKTPVLAPKARHGAERIDLGPILGTRHSAPPGEEITLPVDTRHQAALATVAARAPTLSGPASEVPAQPVAGVSTVAPAVADAGSTVPAARAGAASGEPSLALGQAGWREALAERVTVLAESGTNAARLRLHPEHLGPLEVRVTVVDDKATVWFVTHSTTAREALETALPRLREMLDATGLELGEASVSQHESGHSTPDRAPPELWAGEPELHSGAEPVTIALPDGRLLDAYA